MTKPRVLLLTHYFETHRGGVEIVAGKIANELARRGYAINWAASDTDPVPHPVEGIRTIPMRTANITEKKLGIPYPIWSTSSLRVLEGLIADADIVHLHDSLYFGNAVGAKKALRHRKPYVVTQHIGFIPYKNPVFRTILQIANRKLALGVLKNASGIAFISENTQKYFYQLGLPESSGVLVPNGVDTSTYKPSVGPIPQIDGLDLSRPICLFVGRFVEKKGLPTIRKIAEALPEVQWLLAGWGPIDPSAWNLPNVRVMSNLSGTSLVPLYQSADLLVLPSVGEGFPLVVQEAMACGTPVLITKETASACSAAAPYVFSLDAEPESLWIERVRELTSDCASLRQGAARRANFARENWSWEQCVDQYERIFAQALSR